jgi:RimJ/RimL family protein N-acetyltransferase
MIARELRWTDFDALVEMYFHLYDERDRGEPIGIHLFHQRPSAVDEIDWFAGLYRRTLAGDCITSVAEEEGRPVGSCTIAPDGGRLDSELGHVGVLGVLVDHRYRGRGAGRAMMIRSLEAARTRFETVRLSVFADNERAKSLYRHLGFVLYGTLPRGVRRGERYFDQEFMFLDLRGWSAPPAPNR